jgi:hypothetical protein
LPLRYGIALLIYQANLAKYWSKIQSWLINLMPRALKI